MGIRAEEKRLRRTFRRLLLLGCAAPASAYAACTGGDGGSAGDHRTPDSAVAADGGDGCAPSAPYFVDASSLVMGDANCFYFVDFPCGSDFQGAGEPCGLAASDCAKACTLEGTTAYECEYWPGYGCYGGAIDAQPGRPTRVACVTCYGVGRRPSGLVSWRGARARSAVGAYFARAAYLEAASAHAFDHLARELRSHRAPRDLVVAAERSAHDETRHARETHALAIRYGAGKDPPALRVRRRALRSLETMALENAVEGCVRETLGAAVATWQSVHASDPAVRRVLRGIAQDETRHAALAWAVAGWADPRLDARARARLARARRSAVATLGREVSAPIDPELATLAGLPGPRQGRRILDAMQAEVWGAPLAFGGRAQYIG